MQSTGVGGKRLRRIVSTKRNIINPIRIERNIPNHILKKILKLNFREVATSPLLRKE